MKILSCVNSFTKMNKHLALSSFSSLFFFCLFTGFKNDSHAHRNQLITISLCRFTMETSCILEEKIWITSADNDNFYPSLLLSLSLSFSLLFLPYTSLYIFIMLFTKSSNPWESQKPARFNKRTIRMKIKLHEYFKAPTWFYTFDVVRDVS